MNSTSSSPSASHASHSPNPWKMLFIIGLVFVLILLIGGAFSVIGVIKSFTHGDSAKVASKNSIMHLELNGIIISNKKFLKTLGKYADDKDIKAIVLDINSPGGVVGPSQEIYTEIKRVREKYKKPVVAVSTGLLASGAYYSAVAADKIVVAPGTMMGSIGVIMEFMNLEKLYDWAKVSRYTINTGKYKDSGAEYRAMRPDERELFQDLVNNVYEQFVGAVAEGRNLKVDFVKQYADGRVMTGQQGVDLKFADETGTVQDAYDLAAKMANLGDDYDIFEPNKKSFSIQDFVSSGGDSDDDSKSKVAPIESALTKFGERLLPLSLSNQPLYLMPGYL